MKHVRALPLRSLAAAAILASALFGASAFAGPLDSGKSEVRRALDFHHDLLTEFSAGEFRQTAQLGMNELVSAAVQALRDSGYTKDADRFAWEWNRYFAHFFSEVQGLDVGDHAPINVWFANFYKTMKDRFGDRFDSIPMIADLNALNYTIPVVFHPAGNGKTHESWDRDDYRMHFVPFSGIITYWGSYAACTYGATKMPTLKRYCKRIAGLLKTGVTKFVAPKASYKVYDTAMARLARRTSVHATSTDLVFDEPALLKLYQAQR